MMLKTQELIGVMLKTQELVGMSSDRHSVRGGEEYNGQLKVWETRL